MRSDGVTPESVLRGKSANELSLCLHRIGIGRRLTLCFVLIIVLMLCGNGLLLWQSRLVRAQAERLTGVDQELIAVLRFQNSLRSFQSRLNELSQFKDMTQALRESEALRSTILENAQQTQAAFDKLPPDVRPDPTVLATLEAIQSALPSHLEAIRALATSGDWQALRLRLVNQVQPLEFLSTELVKGVDAQVAEERAQAALNIDRVQRRIFLIVPITGLLTLLIAGFLGVVITRSIAQPLEDLMEGSRALARGEFQHQIPVNGEDELAQLSLVFNDTARKLHDLYATLKSREELLAEAQRLSHTGSWAWDVVARQLTWSDETFRIWGLDPQTTKATQELFLSLLHPEDRSVMAGVDSALSSGQGAEFDYRIVLPGGTIKYLHSIGHSITNESGQVVQFVGTVVDVTEQRNAGKALEEAFKEIKLLKDQLYKENVALREEIDKVSMFEEIVGSSVGLRRVLIQVSKVARADTTVLILGETGTGKELIARAIHKESKRAGRAFIRVNCAAIPPSLVSSELFGHEKGAFTGAIQRRLGRFESADGGTIFLDEIGDLPAETQVVLLRVLQEREFERVGGNRPIPVDVRILAATNRDLNAAVAAGAFRQDLFYRLNVFPIQIPALRERADDIPLLVEYLIDRYTKKSGKRIRTVERKTLELFQAYDWPGNIRELQNVVERAVLLCDGDTFSVDESWLRQETRREAQPAAITSMRGLSRLDADQEKQLIEAALAETQGKVSGPSGAAAKLGIPRQTLESKIASLGIDKYKFQTG
jgi:transcriptional regulator with GAF, ATPase, and Fis domain/PAS domain-containing protein